MNRFIFTGTPGSGKTAVIQALEKLGHTVVHESATEVIAQEQKMGNMRPWEQADFLDKIMVMQKIRLSKVKADLQFHDRSLFCVYALGRYLAESNHQRFMPSPKLLTEIDYCLKTTLYQNQVFFFENLGFIEHTDARKISYEDALIFEKIHLETYKQFGFEIILVPKQSIQERCEFILKKIKVKSA